MKALWQRAGYRPRGVRDPEHARTLYVREPGDLGGTRGKKAGRPGKVCGRNPGVHAAEESDVGVVLKKEPNKIGVTQWRRRWREGWRPRGILKRRLRTVRRDRRKH